MDWHAWHARFTTPRPLPDVARDTDAIPAPWRPVLAASLARFARGETGEGRVANEVAHLGWPAIDDAYVAALRGFIAEEGRHARILGQATRALGGRPAPDAWTGRVFELGRRALDARFELVALLGAEVAAIAAYGTLADALPDCGLRDALRELVRDEADHLAFHADLFRAVADTPARRALFLATLSAVVTAAAGVLFVDHLALWRTLGVSPVRLTRALRRAHAAARDATVPACGWIAA